MKKEILLAILTMSAAAMFSQSQFEPGSYLDFIESNKSLDANGLIQQYPAQTTYYSSRTYPAELEKYPWFDTINKRFELTEDECGYLKQNYFMVTERLQYLSWTDAYINLYANDLPLFLSTDFILHTLHQSYDEILKSIEIQMLEPNLKVLLKSMYDYFPTLYAEYNTEAQFTSSLADVDLYLAVARSLLENDKVLPQYSPKDKYDEVMTAIVAEELVEMPLFTRATLKRKLDFSQFEPRGHYTDVIWTKEGERTLEDYFRTMMWLGRIDFLLTAPPGNPWETDWKDDDLLRMNISALLLNKTLMECGNKELFDRHEEIISYLVGPDDNMTPDELQALSSANLESIGDLLDTGQFNNFKVLLNASDDFGQKIMSNFFYVDPDDSEPGKLPISYKLLGQKFLIDSYVFSEVVYDRIELDGQKIHRPLPDPLDMMSVFGNEDAMALMQDEMAEYKYAYKISELKYLVDSYDQDFWTQSLYNTWLSGLIKLNPVSDAAGLPYFMQTTAWHHEKLNTQLTSWAQLRHDNILYGKQSYTGGTGCSYPYTFVEPYPEFYAHLASFAENAETFFADVLAEDNADLKKRITDYYSGYTVIMNALENIAAKELKKERLLDSELIFLKTMINDYMASGPSVSGWFNDLLFPAMDMYDFDFTVADVHTQPTDAAGNIVGHVLHVGNGMINLGVFLAPNPVTPNKNMCYIGPVGSFHTEVTSNFERYNDIDWEKKFLEGQGIPERPDWVYAYLADESGKTKTPEIVLKGIEYNGIENVTEAENGLSYLLAYPNPASDEVHFRFILNQRSCVTADVFDVTGRLIENLCSDVLPAAEHDLQMNLGEEQSGIYLIRLQVDDQSFVKRFIVQ